MNFNMLPPSPFVGLRPFESSESLLIFGRSEQTITLLQKLHETRLVAVLGSSGCGKSSLIKAGLIPKIQAGFLVEERDKWIIAKMRPGIAPLHNLAVALLKEISTDQNSFNENKLIESIKLSGAKAILDQLSPILENSDNNLLLFVDQFEEIFRFCLKSEDQENQYDWTQGKRAAKRDEATDFISIILNLAEQRKLPIYVVLTMRSEFIGECDAFFGLPETLNRSQYLVPRLIRQQLREAIEGPINLFGKEITPRLVDCLLNDTGSALDQLPLLQHLLMRLWEYWKTQKDGPIDIAHYEAIGTFKNALSIHAEEALANMTESDIDLTKKIFQSLTDKDASNRSIRRPAYLNEIQRITEASHQKIIDIIEQFWSGGRCFLISSFDPDQNDHLLDISHESLIRQWQRLKNWVDEEAEDKARYLKMVEAAHDYNKEEIDCWRDPQLQMMLDWSRAKNPTYSWALRYHADFEIATDFLDKCMKRRHAENMKKRNRYILTSILSAALMISLIGSFLFHTQQKIVKKSSLFVNYWLRAIEAKQKNDFLKSSHFFAYSAKEGMNQSLVKNCITNIQTFNKNLFLDKLFNNNDAVEGISFSNNRNWFLTWGRYSTAKLWNTKEGTLSIKTMKHNGRVLGAKFSKNDNFILTWGTDNTARLWHTNDGSLAFQTLKHDANIIGADLNKEGNLILTWSYDDTLRLWNTNDRLQIPRLMKHNDIVRGATFNKDGTLVLSWSDDGTARLWNAKHGAQTTPSMKHKNWVRYARFNKNENLILTCSDDSTASLWYAKDGSPAAQPMKHDDFVTGAIFSEDEELILTWSDDGTARLWFSRNGTSVGMPMKHNGPVNGAIFCNNEKMILTCSEDSTVRLWDRNEGSPLAKPMNHEGDVKGAVFDEERKLILSWSDDKTARLWNIDGLPATQIMKHDDVVTGATSRKEENEVITISIDGTIRFWHINDRYLTTQQANAESNLENPILNNKNTSTHWEEDRVTQSLYLTGISIAHVLKHDDAVNGALFNKTEDRILTWSDDNTARLWKTKEGLIIAQSMKHNDVVNGAKFNEDENLILTWSCDSTARLWHANDCSLAIQPLKHNHWVLGATFNNKENLILTWSLDRTACLWNKKDGSLVRRMEHKREVAGAKFNNDGNLILTWSVDNNLRLWRAEDGSLATLPMKHDGMINGAKFNKTGDLILSWSADGTVRLWNIKDGSLFTKPVENNGNVIGALFDNEENQILTWTRDGVVRLWDVKTGLLVIPPMKHDSEVNGASFNNDERLILSWSADRTARLWHTKDGILTTKPMSHNNRIVGATFSKDESMILTWSHDGTARLWSVKDGAPIAEPMKHDDWVNGASFNNDDNLVLTWSRDGAVRLWDISADYDFPKKHFPLLVEVITGTKMDDYGNISALGAEEWNSKKQKYIEIAEKHLKECKYKNANLYLKQREIWGRN